MDATDDWTRRHCDRVSELCGLIGLELGLDRARTEQLRLAGSLHDVGKVGIPSAIAQKPGALDAAERAVMQRHPELGERIVRTAGLEEPARWILHHHERVDGDGYPSGLSGDEIPLESRIILVADTFEAITADRP